MNRIQRRLFRTFLKSGGDIVQETEVDRFVRCVEMSLSMLPPKVQAAVVLALAAEDAPHYNRLAAELLSRGQDSVTAPALRQRVSRGLRLIEEAIRSQSWNSSAAAMRRGISQTVAN